MKKKRTNGSRGVSFVSEDKASKSSLSSWVDKIEGRKEEIE